ncbi:hypothetical protein QR680_003461 [Steinernema hermaphroditum]|uniref:Glyoxylate reductase/hydroxypyruvate reductase n=1 Tax=Steinernema hermaphroditum TaxID=289476 RepID=A0AA39LKF4_9BILA|nr:hypothetical protein QR680_003461 [Steinernema hermaphroditum]
MNFTSDHTLRAGHCMQLLDFLITAAFISVVRGQALLFPHGYFNENKLSAKDAIYLNLLAQSALEYGGTTLEELNKLAEEKHKVPRIDVPNSARKHGLEKEIAVEKHTTDEEIKAVNPSSPPTPSLPSADSDNFVEPLRNPKSPFVRYAPEKRNIPSFSEEDDEKQEEVDNPFAAIATRPPKHARHRKLIAQLQARRQVMIARLALPSVPLRRHLCRSRERIQLSYRAMSSQRPRILVTNNAISVARLQEIGEVIINPRDGVMDRKLLLEMSEEVDAIFCLLTDRIDEEFLNHAKRIKVVATMSVGYEHINVEACKSRHITICNTPGVLTETVAELTVALLLATSRRLPESIIEAKTGGWAEWKPYWMCGKDIRGSTIGIFGMGRIGLSVAEKLKIFNPKRIIYSNRSKKEVDYDYVSFQELLSVSDFLIVCASSNPDTVGLFNASNLRKMKKDAVLINTSRGNLVKMDDLAELLSQGHLFAAGLDVTDPEPLPTDHQLFKIKNCVILPHIGSASNATRDAMAAMAIDGIVAGLKGEKSEGMKEFLDS